jgi:tetratricopeptide (TPR) repeat protein
MIEDEKSIIDPAFVTEYIEKPEHYDDSIVADKIEKLYREHKQLGYYGVLDINRRASIDEIKRAYYKVAKEFHPDRHLSFQSGDLKEKLNAVFAYINEAYNVLVEQNQGNETQTETSEPSIDDKKKKTARMKFEEGREFFKSKNYEQALLLLEQAVQFDKAVPEYHYYYGLCLLKNTKLKDSQKYLRKALELDPGNSVYTAELGRIYLKIGLKTKARNAFETALKNDPSNDTAREGLEALSRKPL